MKRVLSLFFILLLVLCPLMGCSKKVNDPTGAEIQLGGPKEGDTIAIFETDMGTFKAALFSDLAPLAVENFVNLAESGYYDGLIFHRVVPKFVIQTGDPTGTGSGGAAATGTPFKNEYSEVLHHFRGALGMANSEADKNGSQFYVVQGDAVSDAVVEQMQLKQYTEGVIQAYKNNGGAPALDYRYTVFGQVYEGLDVIEKINSVEVDGDERPVSEVYVIKVTIAVYSAA